MISAPKLRSPSKSQMAKRGEMHKETYERRRMDGIDAWKSKLMEARTPVDIWLNTHIELLKGKVSLQEAWEYLPRIIEYGYQVRESRERQAAETERAQAEQLKELEAIAAEKPKTPRWGTFFTNFHTGAG